MRRLLKFFLYLFALSFFFALIKKSKKIKRLYLYGVLIVSLLTLILFYPVTGYFDFFEAIGFVLVYNFLFLWLFSIGLIFYLAIKFGWRLGKRTGEKILKYKDDEE